MNFWKNISYVIIFVHSFYSLLNRAFVLLQILKSESFVASSKPIIKKICITVFFSYNRLQKIVPKQNFLFVEKEARYFLTIWNKW